MTCNIEKVIAYKNKIKNRIFIYILNLLKNNFLEYYFIIKLL